MMVVELTKRARIVLGGIASETGVKRHLNSAGSVLLENFSPLM